MKKYFLIAIILAFTAQINAQSNLAFNQVLNFVVTTSSSVTVPEGKVWKIERNSYPLRASKQEVDYGIGLNDAYYFEETNRNALWFAEGTTITADSNDTSLSILEFNVVAVSSGGNTGGNNSSNDDIFNGGGQVSGDDYTPGETITDNDGNTYETVNIGNQTWTTSNLNVSTYRDGTPIPHITNWEEWRTAPTGAYTYVAQTDNGYGKVYNYWAIIGKNDVDPNTPLKKLAPDGFHIPTEYEWNQLANIYGGVQNAGYYVKSEEGWATDLNGNNESGLNLKPGGYVEGFTKTSGWTSTGWSPTNLNGTYYQQVKYGTKTINNSGNTFKSVRLYASDNEFVIDTSNYIYNPDIATICNGGCTTGVYIRLVKD
tara:strand:+ start:378 stop:1490 length:1113 start_codon:yes stop_codon:yes gene_type:complete